MIGKISIRYLILGTVVGFVCLVVAAMTLLANRNLDLLTRLNVAHSDEALKELLQENYTLAQKVVTTDGERLVALEAKSAAAELGYLLQGRDLTDYQALRADGGLRAVAARHILSEGKEVGYLDVYDLHGVSVWHPNREVEGKNFSSWQEAFPRMWELVQRSFREKEVRGYYSFIDDSGNKRRKYMVMHRIVGTPFIVTASVTLDSYFLPVQRRLEEQGERAADQIEHSILLSAEAIAKRTKVQAGLWGLALLLICSLLGLFFSGFLARPIQRLCEAIGRTGQGGFQERIAERGPREIVALTSAYNRMGEQLAHYVDQVREETAAREAMEAEILVGRQIQESLLPHTFPPFPEHREFSLYGINVPAREVAGDFYDFFFVDEQTLVLLIGDVAGKGVPAALYMAVTRTLFRLLCASEDDPGTVMTKVNQTLSRENDACMFVTVFLAYYRVDSGLFRFANGGHDNALLVGGEKVRESENPGNVSLGIDGGLSFHTLEDHLEVGETLFLYTDGITEAVDERGELFGKQALLDLLESSRGKETESMCRKITIAVEAYQDGNRFDDITLLLLQRTG